MNRAARTRNSLPFVPSCGESVILDFPSTAGTYQEGQETGCAILLASASLMTLAVAGKRVVEAQVVAEQFISLLTAASPSDANGLGDLAALAGVRESLAG
jgi:nitrogen fixation protein NifU and related proteins